MDLLNGHGIAHGGMIFALAGTAFAYACNSRNVETVAQSATIACLAGKGPAGAQEQALSGRSGACRMTVTNQKGGKIAVLQGLSRSLGKPVIN